jgi:serine protease inhibitor
MKSYLILLFGLCTSVLAIPTHDATPEKQTKNLVGVASHIVTNSLLQGHVDLNSNYVFSPLGFSSILAILNEGAGGQTKKEIESVLNLDTAPIETIRQDYEKSLNHLSESNPQNAPQFKTWFYVYKPNKIDDDYKKIIEKYYSVDVKDIKRFEYDDTSPEPTDFTYPTTDSNDALEFSDEIVKDDNKDAFDKLKHKIEDAEKSVLGTDVEDDVVNVDLFKNQKVSEVLEPPTPDQLTDSSEIMQAMESHQIRKRMRSLIEDDVASALSGNSMVGKNENGEDETDSQMLLFNGLYFRGNWLMPFQQLRSNPNDVFYNTSSEKTQVTMMRTRGLYRSGYISSIESHAVEIPYENERYSLLILMPKPHNGIKSLIKQFTLNTLDHIDSQMREDHLHLAVPKFRVETTGRAEKAFAKAGVTSLFTRKADLSGITKETELHVDELVQHVSVRVDEGAITQNAFSATNAVRSEPSADGELLIDHPFLFFVRDRIDDIVVVAGHICHIPSNKLAVTFFKKENAKEEKIVKE